jgi:transcriptional regulator with XRE-family HTH domain
MTKLTPLKIWMLENRVSQRHLARETGINLAQICWISQGRLLPSQKQASRIAKAVKCKPEDLFAE